MVTELLALRHVADVDLDDRERACRDRVAKDDGRVGEPAGIDDGTFRSGVPLQEVDERALVVRLVRGELGVRLPRDRAAAVDDLAQSRRSVGLRLARADGIQVRPVDQQKARHLPSTMLAAARSAGSPTSVTSLN